MSTFSRRFSRLPSRLKATYLLISLVVLVGLGVFVWAITTGKIKPFAAGGASLSLASSAVNEGDIFPVYLYLYNDTGSGISAVTIRSLNFDNQKLEIQGSQITPDSTGDWQVIENSTDQAAGKINYLLTAADPTNGFVGTSSRLGIINFKATAAGQANLWFNYRSGIGECDVVAKDTGEDILVEPSTSFVTINSIETPGPSESSGSSTPRPSGTPTKCLKGCSPTPTPTSTEVINPEPTPTPTEVVVAPTSTPETIIPASPIPSEMPSSEISSLFSPEILISPSAGVTHLADYSISKKVALLLYIGIPVLVVIIVFLIWWWKKKKKLPAEGEDTGDEFTNDDEEI